MKDCTKNFYHEGEVIRLPLPNFDALTHQRSVPKIFGRVMRVFDPSIEVDVTIDPLYRLNPELLSPHLIVPAIMLA